MKKREARRVYRELTPDEQQQLERDRERIAEELPDLIARNRMRKEARAEATLSGELRRAVHQSDISLSEIARQAGIPLILLDEFLTGERTLRSDIMDRLASIVGYQLSRIQ